MYLLDTKLVSILVEICISMYDKKYIYALQISTNKH